MCTCEQGDTGRGGRGGNGYSDGETTRGDLYRSDHLRRLTGGHVFVCVSNLIIPLFRLTYL